MTGKTVLVEFTAAELEELRNLLAEEAGRMDDDGREGAFAASPLKPISTKLREASRKVT